MSHYTVLVMTDDYEGAVEAALAPFDEEIEVEPYVESTREDIADDAREAFGRRFAEIEEAAETSATVKVVYSYRVGARADETRTADKALAEEYRAYIEGLSEEDLYFEGVAYNGYEKDDLDEEGNFLTTYNPDAKWDWYVEGGRWGDGIPTKGGEGTTTCLVSEIEWVPDSVRLKAAERYWDVVVDGAPKTDEEIEDGTFVLAPTAEYMKGRYGDKEGYAIYAASFSTYAVLTPEGEWMEPGPMGLFGCTGADVDTERAWDDGYRALVESFGPDVRCTLVDCHI